MHWLLNRYVIAAAAILALLAFTHLSVYRAGKSSVQAAWDKERAAVALAVAAAEGRARAAEQALQAAANQHQRDKDETIRALNGRHRAIVERLRERPARPAAGGMPVAAGTTESAAGCTGAGLHREDGEFLAGEAARADQLRAELSACYRQYDEARELIKRHNATR